MANNLPIQTMLTKRMAMVLRNKATMLRNVDRQLIEGISNRSARLGGIINVELPPRYVGRRGPLMKTENTVIPTKSVALQQAGVDLGFDLLDLQLTLDDVMNGGADKFLEPAMNTIVSMIEGDGTALYKQVGNVVGSTTVMPSTTLTLANAGALITASGGEPSSTRSAILEPFLSASFADSMRLMPNPSAEVGKAFLNGYMGRGVGFDVFTNAFVQTHTAGVYGGAPLVNGAGQTGTTLITDGWTAGSILNAGDVISITGVTSVNPSTRQSTGRIIMRAVAATTTADGSGNMTITLTQPITPTGQFQNVSASPANDIAINVLSGASGAVSKQSMAMDPAAFTFACVPMAKVRDGLGADSQTVTDKESGISVTMTQFYTGENQVVNTRIDVLYAWLDVYPELAVRVQSPANGTI